MKTWFILFALLPFYIYITPCTAQKFAMKLVDNFEDGDLEAIGNAKWKAFLDRDEGGNSEGYIANVGPGYRSRRCLHYNYRFGRRYRHIRNGAFKTPHTTLGLLLSPEMRPCDLSPYQGVSFYFKGQGHYQMVVVTKKGSRMQLHIKNINITHKSWQHVQCLFRDFIAISPLPAAKTPLDSSIIVAIGIGRPAHTTNQIIGQFWLDEFSYIRKSKTRLKKTSQKGTRVNYIKLSIYKFKDWQWQKGNELSWPKHATTIHFVGLPMINRIKIPFSNGIMADPGNPKELIEGTRYELQKLGFSQLKLLKSYKKRLRRFRSTRFIFQAKIHPLWMLKLKGSGIKRDQAYIQVDFVKYSSHTYEIITFIPWEKRKKALKRVHYILYNLDRRRSR